ncbi:MAG: glycosyltransferase family 4 protein [Patescibacteria group bacterium]
MNILFLTRKVDSDDDAASFVSDWIREFSAQLAGGKLIVICQEMGRVPALGENVEFYSLGKERGYGKVKQLLLFQKYLLLNIRRVQGVFAHMIQHYSLMAGPWCFLFRKRLFQWYVHKDVNTLLRLSTLFVDGFVSASQESFRLRTKRPVHIFGHAINIDQFIPLKVADAGSSSPKILTVGRISPVKNIDKMLAAIPYLIEKPVFENVCFQIIGSPGLPSQREYLERVQQWVHEMSFDHFVSFLGPMPHRDTIFYYQHADIFINLSETGSLDKVVLEAMSCGTIVVTSNEAFRSIVPSELFLDSTDSKYVTKKIDEIYKLSADSRKHLGQQLRQIVVKNHSLKHTVGSILALYRDKR